MTQHLVTVVTDDTGTIEISTEEALTDDEILGVLVSAIEVTADRIIARDAEDNGRWLYPTERTLPSA